MALPKITLSAGTSPIEGAIGTYLITLDKPAPAGGLTVYYNTTGSTATLNDDYNFKGGDNLRAVTDNSFTITAGTTTATLNLVAHADGVIDLNEKVVVNLVAGANYDIPSTHQFNEQTTLPVDGNVYSVTTADFNNDGNADLARTTTDGAVSVHLGDGKGGFAESSTIDIHDSYISFTTADFNNDGKTDLVGNNALVLLGDGKGRFTVSSEFAKPFLSVTVADFNNDGNADLAATNYGTGTVSVRLGNGKGGFADNTTIKVGGHPFLITIADFNNDGKMDLATANNIDKDYTGKNDTVSVLLGDGNGGFTVSSKLVMAFVSGAVVADFNNDGNADLATTAISYSMLNSSYSSTVSVIFGNGIGGFTGNTTVTVDNFPRSLIAADFNNDGKMDFATGNSNSNTVSVFLGNGSEEFTDNTTLPVDDIIYSVTTADFNNDGNADLATANRILLFTGDFTANLLISDPANHTPTGLVMLNDFTPKLNQLLTVKNTLTDVDGLGAITYQWQANNVNIGIGNSYKVTGNEVGKAITVIASYTDGVGYTETISSKPVTVPLTASFTITPTTPQNTGENGKTASYSIHLNTAPLPNQNVVVTFTSSDTSEGIINNPTLTFTSANYATPQTLKIRGVDDYLDDGDIPYSVTAQVTTLDVFYKKLTIAPFNLTNTDDGLDKALDLKGDQGGSKIDILSGGNGADTLHGLNMDDNLSGGIGNDTVYGGYGDDNLFGEDGDDQLFGEQNNDYMDGGAGNDVLSGGVGNDNLTGGSGQDSFLFDSALKANVDTITDFKPVDDTITLENLIFTKLTAPGVLNADNFVTATAAIDSNDYLVYNKATGALFYDADGSGAGAGIQIATIGVNLALTAADFVVI